MANQKKSGFLILDRKGEYIKDTLDQRGNTVFGLHHHPKAPQQMVIVSMRDEFSIIKKDGQIHDYLKPEFNIRDIDPIDLADFLPGLTTQQADLIRDYSYIEDFYEKLLAETPFGMVDKSRWFKDFPGLFDLKDKGKKLLKKFEAEAATNNRQELNEKESEELQEEAGGTKPGVLERAAATIKRFCLNPFFGSRHRGRDILVAPSCVNKILEYLGQGKFVFIDMRGQSDEAYTMVAALFARCLLTTNKNREDEDHVRACIIMEEAHNILSEEELAKGGGRGSIFVELAREGRSFKLGFVLVTQQPDARSIAPQVVKTIDTVVAFNMPPEDAKHLQRLKSAFADLELEISNAHEFRGVAISDAGPVFFYSAPINDRFMQTCIKKESLEEFFLSRAKVDAVTGGETKKPASIEDRLAMLMKERQENIGAIALATMKIWNEDNRVYETDEDPPF
jgi:hypothetical protein